ncbi:hypothetical protein VEE33_13280 [Escherichia coli]|nr:hypothetical protein VEE33_13280 [Escherichia coli]BEG26421.1 hypothetical protein VEF10_29840 [Escherichia coli]
MPNSLYEYITTIWIIYTEYEISPKNIIDFGILNLNANSPKTTDINMINAMPPNLESPCPNIKPLFQHRTPKAKPTDAMTFTPSPYWVFFDALKI